MLRDSRRGRRLALCVRHETGVSGDAGVDQETGTAAPAETGVALDEKAFPCDNLISIAIEDACSCLTTEIVSLAKDLVEVVKSEHDCLSWKDEDEEGADGSVGAIGAVCIWFFETRPGGARDAAQEAVPAATAAYDGRANTKAAAAVFGTA